MVTPRVGAHALGASSCGRSPPCIRITRPRSPRVGDQHVRAAAENGDRQRRARARAASARRTSSPLRTVTSQSAGPPTLKVVSGASGASRCSRAVAERLPQARWQPIASSAATLEGADRAPRARRRAASRVHGRELDPVAGRELTRERQIGGDHRRDLRIAAGRLPIRHQQDRLARRRHLQRTDRRGVGQDVRASRVRERRALEPIAHAIRLRA